MKQSDTPGGSFLIPGYIINCLGVLLLVQCLVQAWLISSYPSSINSFLFRQGLSEPLLNGLDQLLMWTLLVCCAGIFYRRWVRLMIPITVIFFLLALFKMLNAQGGGPFFERFALSAQAIRIFFPLAFYLMQCSQPARRRFALQGIQLCSALTFLTHGAECFWAQPEFIDLIIGSAHRMAGLSVSESQAKVAMIIIGIMDLVTAALLLGKRWRGIALWMAIWGTLAACSRMTSGGVDGNWHKALLRVANAGGPLILYLYWTVLKKAEKESQLNS